MVEAKLVFTITLICTAALPRIAGAIQAENLGHAGIGPMHSAGSDSPGDISWAIAAQLQRSASTTPTAMPSMRDRCSVGPSTTPSNTPNATEPRLKKVEASAGRRNG